MDTTVNPADDFYRYAAGGWIDSHPIPEDESYYDVSIELQRNVDQQIIDIINDITQHKQKVGSIEDKIAKFYLSGIDTSKSYSHGLKPLQFLFDSIDNIKSISDIQNGFATLQKYCINAPIDFENGPDPFNAKYFILKLYDYGYCLDSRDYYIDNELRPIADAYKNHIKNMLVIYGMDSTTALLSANKIYDIEYNIAKSAPDIIDTNNPSFYIESNIDELTNLTHNIDWKKMSSQIGFPMPKKILICCGTDYLTKIDKLIETIPVDDWKLYFKYMILHELASYTAPSFNNEKNKFFNKILWGQEYDPSIHDNILYTITYTNGGLVGKLYTDKYYSEPTTDAITSIAENIRCAFAERIQSLDWMGDATKKMALKKLAAMNIKVGHADNYHDYYNFPIKDTYTSNILETYKSISSHDLGLIDKPIEQFFWVSTPQTVNASYLYESNAFEIDAAILQPPFYFPNGDDAVNYGAIGAIIGHEITHGFDNIGKKFKEDGSLYNWWTTKDSIEYEFRSQTLINRFNSFIAIDSMYADGELTLRENIADLGGLEIAYAAFTKTEQWKDQTKLIDGLTPDQRFFIAYAQSWAGIYRDEAIINQTTTNEHSLFQYRVEGPLPSVDAFIKAFNIKPGDRYYLPDSLKSHIW